MEQRDLNDSAEMTMTQLAEWIKNEIGASDIKTALEQAAFLLCCDIIAQDMAKASLHLRERLDNNTSRIVMPREHPIAELLAMEPNDRHTWYEFTEMIAYWSCLTKNSYAVVFRTGDGDIERIVPLQAGRVREMIEGRGLFYDVYAYTLHEEAQLGATYLRVPERDMIHVRGRLLDGLNGYSTMTVGKKTLDVGKAIEKYRDRLFSDDGQTRGVFVKKGEGVLPEEAFQRLKQQLKILMRRSQQTNEPIVLEGDIDFQPISVNPDEAELTKQFEAQVVSTGRLLRIPPHKLFHLANVKYENLETMEKAYVGDTMVPICIQHEQRYAKTLLSRKDRLKYFFEYDREALTLTDTKALTDRVIKAAERGLIEHDEARAKIGFQPLPNGAGQIRTFQANATVVGRDNEVLISAKKDGETDAGDEANSGETGEDEDEDAEKAVRGLRLIADNGR